MLWSHYRIICKLITLRNKVNDYSNTNWQQGFPFIFDSRDNVFYLINGFQLKQKVD